MVITRLLAQKGKKKHERNGGRLLNMNCTLSGAFTQSAAAVFLEKEI
jgi:hypothetical protein